MSGGNSDRVPLNVRVDVEVQKQMRDWVMENMDNSRGALGRAWESAGKEFMDRDRYARMEEELADIRETVKHNNAMLKQLTNGEKEKGVFREEAPSGNAPRDRQKREEAVIWELVSDLAEGSISHPVTEEVLNEYIQDVAGVSSARSHKDYRDTFEERGFIESKYGKFVVTDKAKKLVGQDATPARNGEVEAQR